MVLLHSIYQICKEEFLLVKQVWVRSEEHTSELQSQFHLVCRLLLEKKKNNLTKFLTVIAASPAAGIFININFIALLSAHTFPIPAPVSYPHSSLHDITLTQTIPLRA